MLTKLLALGFNIIENNQQFYKKNIRIRSNSDIFYEEDEYEINNDCYFYKIDGNPKEIVRLTEFFTYLCENYEEMMEITSNGIESACQKILSQCQVQTLNGCNIHESIFFEQIFKNCIQIHKILKESSEFILKNTEITDINYMNFQKVVEKVKEIKKKIRSYRIIISIQQEGENNINRCFCNNCIANNEDTITIKAEIE